MFSVPPSEGTNSHSAELTSSFASHRSKHRGRRSTKGTVCIGALCASALQILALQSLDALRAHRSSVLLRPRASEPRCTQCPQCFGVLGASALQSQVPSVLWHPWGLRALELDALGAHRRLVLRRLRGFTTFRSIGAFSVIVPFGALAPQNLPALSDLGAPAPSVPEHSSV
ncbi:UNVERIFIED_CONTAM: hypothetical protein FKN15_040899 [Acipenser sinensis]